MHAVFASGCPAAALSGAARAGVAVTQDPRSISSMARN